MGPRTRPQIWRLAGLARRRRREQHSTQPATSGPKRRAALNYIRAIARLSAHFYARNSRLSRSPQNASCESIVVRLFEAASALATRCKHNQTHYNSGSRLAINIKLRPPVREIPNPRRHFSYLARSVAERARFPRSAPFEISYSPTD